MLRGTAATEAIECSATLPKHKMKTMIGSPAHLEELIGQAQQGTPGTLEQLRVYLEQEEVPWLIIALMRKGVREADAPDAARRVIEQFLAKIPKFRGHTLSHMRFFLQRYYVPNVARTYRTKWYRETPFSSVAPEACSDLANVPDSSQVFSSIDTRLDCERIYHMLITVLPTNEAGQRRRSILRYVVEEKSQKDMAQLLQISNSLVTKDLQYIRALIVAIETAYQQFAANLSDDQLQLLRLAIQGKRLNEITSLLGISLHRVKQELQEIRRLLYAILERPEDHGGGGQGKTREARSLERPIKGVRPGHGRHPAW